MDNSLAQQLLDQPESAEATLTKEVQKAALRLVTETALDAISEASSADETELEDTEDPFPDEDVIIEDIVFNETPLQGMIDITDASTGKVTCRFSYVDGALHGPGEILDEDGNVTDMLNYDHGCLHGVYERLSGGTVTDRLHYRKGKLHGLCEFFKDGIKQSEMPFENGHSTGEVRIFNDKGILMSITHYENGCEHGTQTVYNEDGKIAAQYNYFRGKKQGKSFIYYASGAILEEGSYNQGMQDGTFLTYYENGNVSRVAHFKDDKLLEVPIQFDPKGRELED